MPPPRRRESAVGPQLIEDDLYQARYRAGISRCRFRELAGTIELIQTRQPDPSSEWNLLAEAQAVLRGQVDQYYRSFVETHGGEWESIAPVASLRDVLLNESSTLSFTLRRRALSDCGVSPGTVPELKRAVDNLRQLEKGHIRLLAEHVWRTLTGRDRFFLSSEQALVALSDASTRCIETLDEVLRSISLQDADQARLRRDNHYATDAIAAIVRVHVIAWMHMATLNEQQAFTGADLLFGRAAQACLRGSFASIETGVQLAEVVGATNLAIDELLDVLYSAERRELLIDVLEWLYSCEIGCRYGKTQYWDLHLCGPHRYIEILRVVRHAGEGLVRRTLGTEIDPVPIVELGRAK